MTKAPFAEPSEPGVRLLLESLLLLATARVVVRLVPFRVYARVMGRDADSPETPPPDAAHRVSHAIASVSGHVPWRCRCLEQAMAAKAMLRRRGIANTLYLAVARDTAIEAHAWVRCGDVCVTGQAEFDRYTIVARFADEGRR